MKEIEDSLKMLKRNKHLHWFESRLLWLITVSLEEGPNKIEESYKRAKAFMQLHQKDITNHKVKAVLTALSEEVAKTSTNPHKNPKNQALPTKFTGIEEAINPLIKIKPRTAKFAAKTSKTPSSYSPQK